MPDEQDKGQSSQTNLTTGRDVNAGGNVVGRDSIANTTSTTTIHEGGPVARYAVVGLAVVAVLAIGVIALLSSRTAPGIPIVGPSPTATLMLTASLTPANSEAVRLSETPSVSPPSNTPTVIPTTVTPSATPETPTLTASATPTQQPTSTDTPLPNVTVVVVPIFDNFNDQCLSAQVWRLTDPDESLADGSGCLQANRQFFTEGADGRLNVLVSAEGEQVHALVDRDGGCYRDVEVALTLRRVEALSEQQTAYLRVGVEAQRVSGPTTVEVQIRGSNTTGPLVYDINARLLGLTNINRLATTPGEALTIAFRTRDVGAAGSNTISSASKRLTITVNDQPLVEGWSIQDYPCALTLGYQADAQAAMEGFFDEVRADEVRLQPAP